MTARTSLYDRPHRVLLAGAGLPVPDGDGGYTIGVAPLSPPDWYCAIRPASASELERLTSGTAVTRASHVLTGPHRADITTSTQITFGARLFYVNGVINPDERSIETIAFCEEQVS